MGRQLDLNLPVVLWLFFVCYYNPLCTSALKHFRGGSTSYDYVGFSNGLHKIRITVATGWDLNDSPCGVPCDEGDVGKSTRGIRDGIIQSTGSENHFGEWQLEIKKRDDTKIDRIITAEVNSKIEGRITYVSVHEPKWVQEVASFDLQIEDCKYVDVKFEGSSWMDLQMQDCTSYGCKFYIQQKIKFGVRDDTTVPNNSPRVLYQAVNRIKPNAVSQVPLTVMDVDGDTFTCRKASFALKTFPDIKNLSVRDNCVVEIDSTSYAEGSWGMVNIVVEDKPKSEITMGGETFNPNSMGVLSQTQVQFLVQVSKELQPEIVAPTSCLTHSNSIKTLTISAQAGENLRIPIFAKPSPNAPSDTEILDFKVTSIPTPASPLVVAKITKTSSGAAWRSDLLWEAVTSSSSTKGQTGAVGDVPSQYLLQVFAQDSQGYNSEACSFQVEVKEPDAPCDCENNGRCHVVQKPTVASTSSGSLGQQELKCFCPLGFSGEDCSSGDMDSKPKMPTFDDVAGIPNGGLIQCEEFSTCSFAIHSQGRSFPDDPPLLVTAPKSPELTVTLENTVKETSTSLPGNRYVTPVLITTGPIGLYKFCVDAKHKTRRTTEISATYCYHVRVVKSKSSGTSDLQSNQVGFISPTPPGESEVPCPRENCPLLMYTAALPSGKCPEVMSENRRTAMVVITVPKPEDETVCVSQVQLIGTGGRACIAVYAVDLQSSLSVKGEERCYKVTPITKTASTLCRSLQCNPKDGACLAKPETPHTQCVCYEDLVDISDEECYRLPTMSTMQTTSVSETTTAETSPGGPDSTTSALQTTHVPIITTTERIPGVSVISASTTQTTREPKTTTAEKSPGGPTIDKTHHTPSQADKSGDDFHNPKLQGAVSSPTTTEGPGDGIKPKTPTKPGKTSGDDKVVTMSNKETTVAPKKLTSTMPMYPGKSATDENTTVKADHPGKPDADKNAVTTTNPPKTSLDDNSGTSVNPDRPVTTSDSTVSAVNPGKTIIPDDSTTPVDIQLLKLPNPTDDNIVTTVNPRKASDEHLSTTKGQVKSDADTDSAKKIVQTATLTTPNAVKSLSDGNPFTTNKVDKPENDDLSTTTTTLEQGYLVSTTTPNLGKLIPSDVPSTTKDPRKTIDKDKSLTKGKISIAKDQSPTTKKPRKPTKKDRPVDSAKPGTIKGKPGKPHTGKPVLSVKSGKSGTDDQPTTVNPNKSAKDVASGTTVILDKPTVAVMTSRISVTSTSTARPITEHDSSTTTTNPKTPVPPMTVTSEMAVDHYNVSVTGMSSKSPTTPSHSDTDRGYGKGGNGRDSIFRPEKPGCGPLDSCDSRDTWCKAFEEFKVKCTCVDPVTGKKKVVIRPRVSNERLLRAFLIGLAVSTSVLVTGTLVYVLYPKRLV